MYQMFFCSIEASSCLRSTLSLMAASRAFLYLSRICWVIRCLAWARTRLNMGAFLNIEGTMMKRTWLPRRQTCSTGKDRPSLENMVTSSRRTFMVSSASARQPRNISPVFISTVMTWCFDSCSSFTGAPIIELLQIQLVDQMDFILAHSRYRRRRIDDAIQLCDQMLEKNPKDQAAWMLKCQCLIKDNYVDDLETEEEGIAEMMVKDEQTNKLARPGTSFRTASNANPVMRPLASGRLNTGFQRVGTSAASRAGTRSNTMLRTGRVMTKGGVPATSNGRVLRLATASLEQYGENFFDSAKADLRRIAQRRSKARLIFQYLFYVEHNIKKSLQLAVLATEMNNYEDPWWKLALGKCYYHLNYYREAEKQLQSSLKHNHSIACFLYLSRIYEKEDNVEKAMRILQDGKKAHPFQPKLQIAMGRLYDQLHDPQQAHIFYKNALAIENCNVEAVANIASYYYYKQQPEIALKLYQRLVQLGYESSQLWNNLGLCCFANHQYHLYYNCLERALLQAQDQPQTLSDVWYNIGGLYTMFGDTAMALQAYKLAVAHRPDNCQALNNTAVILAQQGNLDSAINYADKSFREIPTFEAAYNLSLWYYQTNQLQKAHKMNQESLKMYPQHAESKELATRLLRKLDTL